MLKTTRRTLVSRWHQVIGDPTIADAICNRIVHTAHRIELKGEFSPFEALQSCDIISFEASTSCGKS